MELRHLRYFKAVAEAKSFHGAARRLHIAQTAVSRTVADLECDLGVTLLERSRTGVALTHAGMQFLEDARDILQRVEAAAEAARRVHREETGSIAVGFLGSAAGNFLPGWVRTFQQSYPRIGVELHEASPREQSLWLERGELDIAFNFAAPPIPDCINAEPLFCDPLAAAVAAPFADDSRPLPVEALQEQPFVLYHRDGLPFLFDLVLGVCARAGFEPRVIRTLDSMQTVLTAVEANQGVSIVPSTVRNLRRNDRVRIVPLAQDTDRASFWMLWKKGSCHSPVGKFVAIAKSLKSDLMAQAAAGAE